MKKDKRNLSNADVVKNRQKASKTKDGLLKMFGKKLSVPVSGVGKPAKVMSNKDRRAMGIEQDPDLEDYQDERPTENK